MRLTIQVHVERTDYRYNEPKQEEVVLAMEELEGAGWHITDARVVAITEPNRNKRKYDDPPSSWERHGDYDG